MASRSGADRCVLLRAAGVTGAMDGHRGLAQMLARAGWDNQGRAADRSTGSASASLVRPAKIGEQRAMTRIGILGAAGRMGRAIAAAAAEAGVAVAGGLDRDQGELAALAEAADVLVDFSSPAALGAHLAAARTAATPILIGTTGLLPGAAAEIADAAAEIAVLQAANTSLGVNLLAALVETAAARLGPDWDIEILEMHHRHKLDAPSGTALLLGEAAACGRGHALDPVMARDGRREPGAIGFASLRGGSVAGDHLVVLAGEGERIELGHRAETREIFARGALRAAVWLAGRPAGRYRMADVLGL
jgi:4-hydroxy-tetrahydrodipicolinate reductase